MPNVPTLTKESNRPDYAAMSKRKKLFKIWIERYTESPEGKENLVNNPIQLMEDFQKYEAEVLTKKTVSTSYTHADALQ